MSKIKSFRGLIADEGQDTIILHTNNGSTGYKITKFQMIPEKPGQSDHRFVMKIYKIKQTTVDGEIDFSDNTMLAAAEIEDNGGASHYPHSGTAIVFDNEIFNQDIHITLKDIGVGESCNYYIELEQMKLDLHQNTMATLKDIRNETLAL
jgi:hypothetical protein